MIRDFRVDNLGSVGIAQDPPAHTLQPGVWSDGNNIRFADGVAQPFGGHVVVDLFSGETFSTFYSLTTFQQQGNYYWIGVGESSVPADKVALGAVGGSVTDLTVPTGSVFASGDKWSGGILGEVPILANGRDSIVQYLSDPGGTPTLVELPYSSTVSTLSAKLAFDVVRPWRTFLLGLGTEVTAAGGAAGVAQGYYPSLLWWSDSADPGTVPGSWNAADTTLLAGNSADPFDMTDGKFVDAVPLDQSLFLYKEDSIFRADFIGAPYVFQFSPMIRTFGALATNCIAAIQGRHLVFGNGDLIWHNGTSWESAVEGRMRRWLFSNIDPDNALNSFIVRHSARNEMWVCFPENGATYPTRALVLNYKENTVTVRDLEDETPCITSGRQTSGVALFGTYTDAVGKTYSDFIGLKYATPVAYSLGEAALISAKSDGTSYQHEVGQAFNGTDPVCYLERTDLPVLGDTIQFKQIIEMIPELEGTGAIQIHIGYQAQVNADVFWKGPYNFTPGTSVKVNTRANGRLHAVRVKVDGGQDFQLRAYTLRGSLAGRY